MILLVREKICNALRKMPVVKKSTCMNKDLFSVSTIAKGSNGEGMEGCCIVGDRAVDEKGSRGVNNKL